jgi:hypothetical protein
MYNQTDSYRPQSAGRDGWLPQGGMLMAKAMRSEQSSFGFVPIVLVSVVIAMTIAALAIAWLVSWIYLKEHQKGVIEGNLNTRPAAVEEVSTLRFPVSKI